MRKPFRLAIRKASRSWTSVRRERPCGIQLFGGDPDTMARAAERAMAFAPDVLDINMGCPMPKINASGSGAVLMGGPSKMRGARFGRPPRGRCARHRQNPPRGSTTPTKMAPEVAAACEAAGAAAVTVHARTKAALYKPGTADWSVIRAVKEAVKIPRDRQRRRQKRFRRGKPFGADRL